jgi:predicted transcriptional regulator
MSNRLAIMQLVANNPSITLDELMDATNRERNKVQWTINDCKADDLILVVRDDVTHKPAYRLTDKGKAWMINRPTRGAVVKESLSTDKAKSAPQQANGKRYFYLFDGEGFDTPEDACKAAFGENDLSDDGIEKVSIISFDIVGRIEVKPTLVMEA